MRNECIDRSRMATTVFAGVLLGASACAVHAAGSTDEYWQDRADAQLMYESARDACGVSSGDRKDVCIADAKLQRTEALALAEARRKGTAKAAYDASLASLDAEYRAAAERCDTGAIADKDACIAQARAMRRLARADAQVAFDALTDRAGESRQAPRTQRDTRLDDCNRVRRDARHDCLRRMPASYRR